MTTLAEFLLARIADREATARDMQHQAARGRPFIDLDTLAGGTGIRELIDPARILAGCAAKRAIVARHGPGAFYCGWSHDSMLMHDETDQCVELEALAMPYADHDDYRDEWRIG